MFSVYFEYPIYFLFITLAFSLGVTSLLYYRNKKNKEVKKSVLFALAALRFIFCFFLSSLLLKPIIKISSIFEERPIIVFAQDNLKSIIYDQYSCRCGKHKEIKICGNIELKDIPSIFLNKI